MLPGRPRPGLAAFGPGGVHVLVQSADHDHAHLRVYGSAGALGDHFVLARVHPPVAKRPQAYPSTVTQTARAPHCRPSGFSPTASTCSRACGRWRPSPTSSATAGRGTCCPPRTWGASHSPPGVAPGGAGLAGRGPRVRQRAHALDRDQDRLRLHHVQQPRGGAGPHQPRPRAGDAAAAPDLERLVAVEVSDDPGLGAYAASGWLLPWPSFAVYVQQNPDVTVSYRDGVGLDDAGGRPPRSLRAPTSRQRSERSRGGGSGCPAGARLPEPAALPSGVAPRPVAPALLAATAAALAPRKGNPPCARPIRPARWACPCQT